MRFIRRGISAIMMACVLGGLAGCLTIRPSVQAEICKMVEDALTVDPDTLHRNADRGGGHAQMSYSLVLRYGLNGAVVDKALADNYREQATTARGANTTAVAGSDHLRFVNVPAYTVTGAQAEIAEECAALLASPPESAKLSTKLRQGVCGGVDNYRHLSELWVKATS